MDSDKLVSTKENASLKAEFKDLLSIALHSLKFSPPSYIESVLGPWRTWFYPHREYSEFTILNPWKPEQTFSFLRDISVPSLPKKVPRVLSILPPIIKNTFWRPSDYFQQNDPFDSATSFPKEKWFFVNGICTDESVARMNSELLTQMFRRPMTVIHNSTNSFFVDLFQCALGKGITGTEEDGTPQYLTEPSIKATTAIIEALNAPEIERVVVVCHSQGTIILSNVIKAIGGILRDCETCGSNTASLNDIVEKAAANIMGEGKKELEDAIINGLKRVIEALLVDVQGGEFDPKEKVEDIQNKVAKFEVYAFANCATNMTYLWKDEQQGNFPYIESFANEKDLVARLGAISPENKEDGLVEIDGPIYQNTRDWWKSHSGWGHLLNQHYLFPIMDGLSKEVDGLPPYKLTGNKKFGETPRLYQYFNGGSPEPLKRKTAFSD